MLEYDFMVRALIAAFVTGLCAPAIGTYLVQRRLALMGDGIGHIAVTGVALGLLTGWAPVLTAIIVAVVGATLIEVIRARGRTSGDVALALLFYGGIAGGVLLAGIAGGGTLDLHTYLFGSITTVSSADVWATVVLSALVVVLAVGLSPRFFAVCHDEDFAATQGLSVRLYSIVMSVMAAVVVAVAMRTVGLLLVSALMVVPVATAQQLARGFRATFAAAMGLGVVASVGGVSMSYYADLPSGPTIVILALGAYAATWPIGAAVRYRRRLQAPFEDEDVIPVRTEHRTAEDHPHEHGDTCGHPAVVHGDHVDYVHDGHRHAAHGDHYDEH